VAIEEGRTFFHFIHKHSIPFWAMDGLEKGCDDSQTNPGFPFGHKWPIKHLIYNISLIMKAH
jgi:hypothetical protein